MATATGESVTLLSLPASPFAMSVKIALAEKGVEFECHEENYREAGKSDMLLQLNPVTKQVPVLVHDGFPVYESLVMLEYIEDAWKGQGTSFFPIDSPRGRAEARFWANYANTKFWETALLVMKRLDDEQSKARDEMLVQFLTMEREWSKLPYEGPLFYSDKLSLPDLVLAPIACWKLAIETLGQKAFPGPDECPRMNRWLQAIEEHPSVKASVLSGKFLLENAQFYQQALRKRASLNTA